MPLPDNPLVCKAALVYRRDTRQFVNTLHFSRAAGWTLGDMQTLASALATWWEDQLRTAVVSAVSLVQVQVRQYDPDNPQAVDLNLVPIPGIIGTPPEPANVTSTISWRTGLAGKKFRGRIYVPGYAESQTANDDTLVSATVTLLTQAASAYLVSTLPAGTNPIVFHFVDATFNVITSFVIENILDSQRRRLPARGR